MNQVQWSFSSLKDFIGCPRRYYEIKVCNNFQQKLTQAITYGKDVHSALEKYVKDGKELPTNYQRFRSTVDALIEIPGQKMVEYEMALRRDKTPCSFNDKDRWVRGIADLLIVHDDVAYVIDYKTGNANYPDLEQLKLMALMIFAIYPEVQEVKGALVFLLKNRLVTENYTRDQVDKMWELFESKVARLEQAFQTNEWTPNPTPLCGYCPVTTCEFNR
jgi:CRISPR/Cas system-associated exonuclease Cas4 (RecB family)